MQDIVHFILVESSTAGWALHGFLKSHGCVCRIAPVPRGLQTCCGMSILVKEADMNAVRAVLDLPDCPANEGIVEMENPYNAKRDQYC